jgi:DinB superfamily
VHAQLETLIADIESATTRLRALERRLSPDAWQRRPAPESWSPAECIAHLNLTAQAMLPRLRAGLDEARRLGRASAGNYRRDVFGWLIAKSLKPGGRMKTKTVAAFAPSGDRPAPALIAEFDALHRDLVGLIRTADGLPLDRVKMASPFNERVKYNLYSALTINTVHDHRHLLQAERAAGE